MDPTASPKAYSSTLKTFFNNKKYFAFHQFIITVKLQIKKKEMLRPLTILANFRPIHLKEQTTFFQLSCLLKMIIAKTITNLDPNKCK